MLTFIVNRVPLQPCYWRQRRLLSVLSSLLSNDDSSAGARALRACLSEWKKRGWSGFPKKVKIVEVGPRDGLQNIDKIVPVAVKVELIRRLAKCGLSAVECTSFVSPRWVPQMADHKEVMAHLQPWTYPSTSFPVLVPNRKGLDAALTAGAKEVAVFASASEQFSHRNINCSIKESMERLAAVCDGVRDAGIRVRGYVSCVIACPYAGATPPLDVVRVTGDLLAMGCYEVSLGDTIGVGTPQTVRPLLDTVTASVAVNSIAVHFHDTNRHALANILTALGYGVRVVDASVAGLGGCPYAPGAAGNVATEDVLALLHGLGVATGVDLAELLDAAAYMDGQQGQPPAVAQARNDRTHASLEWFRSWRRGDLAMGG